MPSTSVARHHRQTSKQQHNDTFTLKTECILFLNSFTFDCSDVFFTAPRHSSLSDTTGAMCSKNGCVCIYERFGLSNAKIQSLPLSCIRYNISIFKLIV